MLVFAVTILSLSGMLAATACWNWKYELSETRSLGQDLGVFGLGYSLSRAFGPMAVALLVGHYEIGWVMVALYFCAISVVAVMLRGLSSVHR
jgi:hypothetical protein